jgi:hypothetical protein
MTELGFVVYADLFDRENLIKSIGDRECSHRPNFPTWNYYDRWLEALERLWWTPAWFPRKELGQLLAAIG